MDSRIRSFGLALNSSCIDTFESWSIGVGDQYHTGTTLQLDSSSSHSLRAYNSKGIKRNRGDIDGTAGLGKDSAVLALGPPSFSYSNNKSSAITCTIFPDKKSEKESFMDYGLTLDLKLGNENTASPMKPGVATLRASETEPKFDLELSLSVGPVDSVMTSIDPVLAHHQDILDKPTTIYPVATVDEGSTSSRWKHGNNLLPYLGITEKDSRCLPDQMIYHTPCPVGLPDFSSTMIKMQKSPVASTSIIAQFQGENTNKKFCKFPGCGKGARGASGLCIAHGGGRRCQKDGCQRGAEGNAIFCKAHGGGRRCEHLGCTKSAEGRTDHCIAHGGGRRCSHEGCIRAARGKSGLCIRHGGGKRCQKENCKRSAEGQSGLCISHGGGRRCKFPQCTKGAQGSTNLCKAHGGGKRCTHVGCTKGAEGSTHFCKGHGGGKRCAFPGGCSKSVHGGTQFCVAHGGGKRCAVRECTRSARGRTDFCVRHGGGKRCKSEGCGKSAQGSTDFCKAHGGGKRCSWGRPGSNLGAGDPPCDHLAGRTIGLCSEHTALVEDHCVHGGHTLEAITFQNPTSSKPEMMNGGFDGDLSLKMENGRNIIPFSLPEDRVHGGNILSMLSNSGSIGSHSGSHFEDSCCKAQVAVKLKPV